ncbi:MAG TPA: helix-turn-helix transcriptional regulator [Planctomycetia bacterium]|nr:helix-turn-helix transcriptional regulator [Planctomycetia bacterium]
MVALNAATFCAAERNIIQSDLAEKLGVSRLTISAVETEKYEPSLGLAFRIERLFGSPIESIFDSGEGETGS